MTDDDEIVEAMARAIDPDAWRYDLPVPTRSATVAFHAGRQLSILQAQRALRAYRERMGLL